jgi:hypothetical protein
MESAFANPARNRWPNPARTSIKFWDIIIPIRRSSHGQAQPPGSTIRDALYQNPDSHLVGG